MIGRAVYDRYTNRPTYYIDGKKVSKRVYDEAFPDKELGAMVPPPANWPQVSSGAGVHPDEIPEALEQAKQLGVSVGFTDEGEAIFTSRRNKKEYCEAVGLWDKCGGYGDAQKGKVKRG